MEKVIRYKFTYMTLLIFVLSGCLDNRYGDSGKSEESQIFRHSLYQSLDSIAAYHHVDGKIFSLYNVYPDRVQQATITGVIKENDGNGSAKIDMLKNLIKVLDDSVYLDIEERESDLYSFYYKQESIKNKVDYKSSSFFGNINLSNVAFSDDRKLACYYIAIQCGSKCGSGYIVIVEFKDDVWSFLEIIPIWQ